MGIMKLLIGSQWIFRHLYWHMSLMSYVICQQLKYYISFPLYIWIENGHRRDAQNEKSFVFEFSSQKLSVNLARTIKLLLIFWLTLVTHPSNEMIIFKVIYAIYKHLPLNPKEMFCSKHTLLSPDVRGKIVPIMFR